MTRVQERGRKPVRIRRRGDSMLEVMAALSIFFVAMIGLGGQWVHTRQQMGIVQEQQALSRMAETCIEDVRSWGSYYLPKTTPGTPIVTQFDARGQKIKNPDPKGFYARTWITYLQNPGSFTDGTAGTVGSSSLREVTVWVYRSGGSQPVLKTSTYVAPILHME